MNNRTNTSPYSDVFSSKTIPHASPDGTKKEAINEEKNQSSSKLNNSNFAPDSNGEFAGIIIERNYTTVTIRSMDLPPVDTANPGPLISGKIEQYEHYWNYMFHHPKKIQPVSKEWQIAIILKKLLVSWDFWTYRIGLPVYKKVTPSKPKIDDNSK